MALRALLGTHLMQRILILMLVSLPLVGCQSRAEKLEIADDESCRRLITERNDGRPEAYKECRANLMQYRNQGAVAASGSTVNTTVINRN
jgi:hypothetical protein